MRVGGGRQAGRHERRTRDDDPLVDRVEQLRLLLGDVCVPPCLAECPEPGHGALGRYTRVGGLIEAREPRAELRQTGEVGRVTDAGLDAAGLCARPRGYSRRHDGSIVSIRRRAITPWLGRPSSRRRLRWLRLKEQVDERIAQPRLVAGRGPASLEDKLDVPIGA